MFKHIPYMFSTAAIIGAVIFVVNGDIQIAGMFLLGSGMLYLTLTDNILATTAEVEEKYPQLQFLSRLIGGNNPRGMKFGGAVLLILGVVWVFLI